MNPNGGSFFHGLKENMFESQSFLWHFWRKQPLSSLNHYAKQLHLDVEDMTSRQEIFSAIAQKCSETEDLFFEGLVDIQQDGFAWIRFSADSYLPSAEDIYVSQTQLQEWHLRTGDLIAGSLLLPQESYRYPTLKKCLSINGTPIHQVLKNRSRFEDMTPIHPCRKINLELTHDPKNYTLRIMDLVAPLGFGQRALIVAPPRTGKTIILQNLAHAIAQNHPDALLMVLLVDERPEEVTEMMRMVKGEVISSTFDEPVARHIRVAEMAMSRAKRMVECGKDVIILLDSITRLARAYNTSSPSSGKVLTGGVDSHALQRPKRLFGSARNLEEGGSLTIIATALIETGSKMDEVIFEEFKGTGNSELELSRKCSDDRCFPAINIKRSGTRKEDLLLDPFILSRMWVLRRILSSMGPQEAIEFLVDKMKTTRDNMSLFSAMNS